MFGGVGPFNGWGVSPSNGWGVGPFNELGVGQLNIFTILYSINSTELLC